jgi:ankyrin repeat protein
VDKLAQQTPLYYAAKKGYLEMSKQLIERGCDVTHHDVHNKTAVEYARRARYH